MLTTHIKKSEKPDGCVIWMHGLGADASDMAGLAAHPLLANLPLTHVFLDAPVRPVTLNGGMAMRAWYDILGLAAGSREDEAGVLASHAEIIQVIDSQMRAGFCAEQIVLAGFSQGGAMAFYSALHANLPLAGVISLSAYIPLAVQCKPSLPPETPFFIGYGRYDSLVSPEWTEDSKRWLISQGYHQITSRSYPIEHSISPEEVADIAHWLSIHVRGVLAV